MNPAAKKTIIALLIIIPFLIIGIFSFKSSLTPYIPFEQIPMIKGNFQVLGNIKHETVQYGSDTVVFEIFDDKGHTLKVYYRGSLPANFSHAKTTVVSGVYNNGIIDAHRVLVKCPSKYQSEK